METTIIMKKSWRVLVIKLLEDPAIVEVRVQFPFFFFGCPFNDPNPDKDFNLQLNIRGTHYCVHPFNI